MTVSTTLSTITLQGNGITTSFAYPFIMPAAGDAVVQIVDTTVTPNTTTTLSATQYAILGIGSVTGGTVNYPLSGSPIASGVYITISRVLPEVQTTSLSGQGPTFASIESALDYLTQVDQQLQAGVTRALAQEAGVPQALPLAVSLGGTGSSTLAGAGIVTGPASATINDVPKYADITGKVLSDGYTVGTSANNLVQMTAAAKLPAVDGSLLTNLPAAAAGGAAGGLKVTNNSGTPSTKIDVTAKFAVMTTSAGAAVYDDVVSVTIDLTAGTVTSAANGMDGEARPSSGWVYVYLINNGSGTTAGLASTSSSAPSLPAGYAYSYRVGAMYCDGSQNLKRTLQYGRRAQYVVTPATNTTALPVLASGANGTYSQTAPTWATVAVGSAVPGTATEIDLVADNSNAGASAVTVIVAPNGNYTGTGTANPPYLSAAVGVGPAVAKMGMILESSNISVVIGGSGGQVQCAGWGDNL